MEERYLSSLVPAVETASTPPKVCLDALTLVVSIQACPHRREPEACLVLPARSSMAAGVNEMTFVVTDNCIKCKYMDGVEVCPVDCFYEGENMLVMNRKGAPIRAHYRRRLAAELAGSAYAGRSEGTRLSNWLC